ncbi:MAG TPA: CDP-alcohol phosphatidyltransferase family protein [Polyangia bacterium]|jgi:CDP-L-myo-inositol myo-inositolphosphotransferase
MPAAGPTLVVVCRDGDAAALRGDIAGLPALVRTVLDLQAGGVGRVRLCGDPAACADAAALLEGEPRVRVPVGTAGDGAAAAPTDGAAVVVLPAGLCLMRDLARRLPRVAPPAGGVARLEAEPPGAGTVLVAAAPAAAALVAAAQAAPAAELVAAGVPVEALALAAREFAVPARTPAEEARATDLSVEALRKPIDGVISRHLNRPVSLFLTRRLMRTRVHPNHVSIITLLVGLGAGAAVALGGRWWWAVGGLLLQLQSVLDGVDGELARLKHLHSRAGEWLDTVSDDLATVVFTAGAGLAVWRATGRAWPLVVGGVGVAALIGLQVVYYTLLLTIYRSGDLLSIPWVADVGRPDLSPATGLKKAVAWLKPVFKHDFIMFAFCVLAIVGRLDAVVVIGSAGGVITFVRAVNGALADRRARRNA